MNAVEPTGASTAAAPSSGGAELKRHARVGSLWALGVGAVISGDFFGWNFGLQVGGFGGMLLATAAMTVMYTGLCFSIAEMSAALPHAGGAYSFARCAFGPWGGWLTGLAESIEYVLTPAVIVVGLGGYLGALTGTAPSFEPLWWLLCYVLFVSLNAVGVALTFRVSVAITLLAIAVLIVFFAVGLPQIDLRRFALPESDADGQLNALGTATGYFPNGARGALAAWPFALWFFLAIEQLPVAAEESENPQRDMPKALLLALLTLTALAFLTLVVSAGLPPGISALGQSDEPLLDSLRGLFGEGLTASLLSLCAVAGLAASFHAIIFGYARQLFALARSGYLPHFLANTHSRTRAPVPALAVGASLGLGIALLVRALSSARLPAGAILLSLAVLGAVVSYVLQMAAFIRLRRRYPRLPRPYRSPLGIPGALIAMVFALGTLVALLSGDSDHIAACALLLAAMVAGSVYFALYARHRLRDSPEERQAARLEQSLLPATPHRH